jgi:uncharacterized membrane protein
MFDKLFDLPAHPLLVHAPVVLLPIAAILMVMFAVKPAWRLAAGWWPLALVGVTVVLLFGAKESGEALIEAYDRANGEGAVDIKLHESLAETTFVMTLVWFFLLAALTAMERLEGLRTGALAFVATNTRARQVLGWLVAVVGLFAMVWMIRTGHEGAKSVWGPRVDILFPEV